MKNITALSLGSPQNWLSAINQSLKTAIKGDLHLPQGRFVSLCFDGVPKITRDFMVPRLAKRQWLADWFVFPEMPEICPRSDMPLCTQEDILGLRHSGHEIGMFGVSPKSNSSKDKAQHSLGTDEIDGFVRKFALNYKPNLAVPTSQARFGYADIRGKMGSIRKATSDYHSKSINPHHLHSLGLGQAFGGISAAADKLIQLHRTGGWAIIHVQDICDKPSSLGCTAEGMETILQAIELIGALVVNVSDMLDWAETLQDDQHIEKPIHNVDRRMSPFSEKMTDLRKCA